MRLLPKSPHIKAFLNAISQNCDLYYSISLVDCISASGDPSGTPFYHWRWKKKTLPDVVIWPLTTEQVEFVVEKAKNCSIPLTPRGGGSCYFGSSVPAYGGAVLDVKRMNQFPLMQLNICLVTQPGVCFNTILEELCRQNLTLGAYPTSAYTATIGGWIGTGGLVGIGTYSYGPFIKQVHWLRVIASDGQQKTIDSPEEFSKYFGSYGTLGIVTEICLTIYDKIMQTPVLYGFNDQVMTFNSITDLLGHEELADQLSFIRVTDVGYESRNHGFEDYQYYLLLVLPTDNYEYIQSQLQPIIAEWKGDLLEIDRAQIIWDNILRDEIKLKLNTAVQMMQQYYLHLSQCHAIIEKFQALIKSYQLTGDFSVIVNRDHQVRLNLYTLTNNTNWIHFLASKASPSPFNERRISFRRTRIHLRATKHDLFQSF